MRISGITKFSTLDYPGNIAAVMFSPGCNYDCFYCHNRGIINCDSGIIGQKEVIEFLESRKGLIDAVVLSGGEITLQPDLEEWAERIKKYGFLVKVDTNGSNPKVIKKLLKSGNVDYFAVDYKAPFGRYKEICGKDTDAKAVKETFEILVKSETEWEARTTVAPVLNKDDLIIMAREAPIFPRYALQLFRKPDEYKPEHAFLVRQTPYDLEWIQLAAQAIKEYQPKTIIRA